MEELPSPKDRAIELAVRREASEREEDNEKRRENFPLPFAFCSPAIMSYCRN